MANTENRTQDILDSLSNRGIELSSHEIHLAILYSRVDTAYHHLSIGKKTEDEAIKAIDEAVAKFRELETPKKRKAL